MITVFDVIIFTIITIFSFLGLYQGIIGFIARIAGFIASIVLACFLSPYLVGIIGKYIENELVGIILSGVISYIISLILCTFITYKFLLIISFIRGGFIDKFFGLLSGLAIGLTISGLLFCIMAVFSSSKGSLDINDLEDLAKLDYDKHNGVLANSITSIYLEELSKAAIIIIPKDTLKSIKLLDNKEVVNFKKSNNKAGSKARKTNQKLQEERDGVFSTIKDDEQ